MRQKKNPLMILLPLIIVPLIFLIIFVMPSEANQAKKTAKDFYKYEQNWDFSKSWELLHSSVQAKFPRSSYIQDRSHVFMNHFGVDTFSFSLSNPKKYKEWKMDDDGEIYDLVYKIEVTKKYNSKYGYFEINKDVFVHKEESRWSILWDYKER
ncbi:hypothetical protein [Bacillus alkalicellulosilyticus]|uniref:hypothetical protein n=1 Tax=Alkalihalobacterium alkalicellulosilyticum TaxID=1912214 RepID=UPI0009982400|nr:hypothetical protein [Bacillus alkalicellulosilyticus]